MTFSTKTLLPNVGDHLIYGENLIAGLSYYPVPGLNTPTAAWGAFIAGTNSPFQSGQFDAVIYSIKSYVNISGASAGLLVQTYDGVQTIGFVTQGASVASTERIDYGPQGILIPGGFRLTVVNAGSYTANFEGIHVAYRVVAKH